MTLPDLLKVTRQYFWNLDFEEVEIPYLNSSLPLEPNIYSFNTIWSHSQDKFYLPTSPEFALKKQLAATKKNCFAIAHCFRDLEAEGPHHTKEFLMLEYYLVDKNLSDLQKSLEKYLSLFLKLKIINYKLPESLPANEPDFNQYFLNEIEPNLPDGGVFITGYPAFLSPLAATNFDGAKEANGAQDLRQLAEGLSTGNSFANQNCLTSQRFELYINKIEIANGCVENRDPNFILQAFQKEQEYRLKNNLPTHPYSEKFISDCASLPPCSGVGLGLNRLLQLMNS